MHPTLPITRRQTRQIKVGSVAVGGTAPIRVQTMTKTDTRDVAATIAQIREIESVGCDIVRLAVIDEDAARALSAIRREVKIPLVADIHFNHKLALIALEAGIDGLRINPGNIGSLDRVREVVKAAAPRQVPIRIGVNAGSLEKELLEKHGGATAEALVESAMRHVRILEDAGHPWIKISVKASDVPRTLQAYRLLSKTTDHPLHLGVTEAGTLLNGTIRSSVALGMLIAEGIGDTLRVSLTDHPVQEIRVGLELLRCLGLRPPGASVISCPTCGRIQIDVVSLAQRVEAELDNYYRTHPAAPHPAIAVMGCMVNGPGEAREADISIAGGQGKAALYVRGAFLATVPEAEILDRLMEQVKIWHD
jgi:(E)-4-hydroxy-3-methylbut-2-enyl-diphosphate synthase